jgi:hypothetical protein
VINSPFTRWEGDDLHGRRPVLTSVWVNLDILFPRSADAPRHVIETGLDLTGVVAGRLHGRFPSLEGDWYGCRDSLTLTADRSKSMQAFIACLGSFRSST